MIRSVKRSYFAWGIAIALLGAVCFSTKAILVKLAYRDTGVDALPLLALRMIFSLPFFIVYAAVASGQKGNVKFTRKQWLSIALIGCLGYYISSLLDFIGLQFVSAGIERLILFIYPTLVLLINAWLYKTPVTKIQGIAVGISYAGLLMAFLGEAALLESHNKNFYIGSFAIFLCAITYALYIIGSGRLIPQVGAAKFNSYAMSFASIGVLLHYFISSGFSLPTFTASVYGYGLSMALLSTVIPSYLVVEGIKRIGTGNAAIVGSIGPVSTILQAYLFLHEPIFGWQIAGTACIVLGVLLISQSKN